MKLLFVVTEYPGINAFGGIGVFVNDLKKGLEEEGVEVHVLVYTSSSSQNVVQDDGFTILQRKKSAGRISGVIDRIQDLRSLREVIKKIRPTIIELSTSDSFYILPMRIEAFLVARTHGSYSYARRFDRFRSKSNKLSKIFQLLHERNLLKQSIDIAAVSQQYFEHYMKPYLNKLTLIENFVGPEYSSLSLSKKTLTKPYIFYHGTIKKIKGSSELIKSFLLSEASNSHILVLAGKGDKSYIEAITENANDKVQWVGECSPTDLKDYLAGSDLSIYPSHRDAFNLAVVEALSQKALVLVSSAIDKRIINDEVTGFVFPLAEISDFSKYIDKAITIPEKEKNILKMNGYEHFVRNYTYEKGIKRNLNYYQNLTTTHEDSV